MTKHQTLFGVYERIVKNDPEGSRKSQFAAFLAEVKANAKLVELLAEEYFERMHAQWKIERVGKSHSLVGTPATQRRVETTAAKRRQREQDIASMAKTTVSRIVDRINRIRLLDMVMPNGKTLRECTGAELTRFGGFYAEVARHLKPSQVVDKHLNEKELQAIWSRFEKAA